MRLNSVQKNTRWKAYVGNVTGTLTLDDAQDNTIYSWSLTSISGEVYASRSSGIINWTGINCTWIADIINISNRSNSNRSPEYIENVQLAHTGRDDNISRTFNALNHSAITVGSRIIGEDECFTIQTYQKDSAQVFDDSDNANFTEIILYDGVFNESETNVIYATFISTFTNISTFNSEGVYNFQMILPESGNVSFTSSTPYYFYVELT